MHVCTSLVILRMQFSEIVHSHHCNSFRQHIKFGIRVVDDFHRYAEPEVIVDVVLTYDTGDNAG